MNWLSDIVRGWSKRWPRVVDLSRGVAMVVTDLHGDWEAYQRYRDRFLMLHDQRKADYLIIAGDLIHRGDDGEPDRSVEMVLDLIRLRKQYGESIIFLMGNHEMPHLYGIPLSKGETNYTASFEAAMGKHRLAILELFHKLPFYVRTQAGVTICHAGGTADLSMGSNLIKVFNFSHRNLWAEAASSIAPEERPSLRWAIAQENGLAYHSLVNLMLDVHNEGDARYDDFMIGHQAAKMDDFGLLWSILFTRNELEYGEIGYELILESMLALFSIGFAPQRVLLSGHINSPNGFTQVNSQQLRLASGKHALPPQAARYLLFDVRKPIRESAQLVPLLQSVY